MSVVLKVTTTPSAERRRRNPARDIRDNVCDKDQKRDNGCNYAAS